MYQNWLGEDYDLWMTTNGHEALRNPDETVGIACRPRRTGL